MAQKNYKISFCVVCMNRLHQLKQTLLKNIADNASYPNLEFIVLDYNSEDGMEAWVKANLAEFIDSGLVIYYKTTEPASWNPSHSKNLAFKLATGDILCSIWADYYTGANFAHYVNQQFIADDNIVLTPIDFYKTKTNHHPAKDVLGKVCVKAADFFEVKGFDERMDKHGFEDYDFINRLEMTGVKRVIMDNPEYLQFIAHHNTERYTLPTDNLHGMYVNYINPSATEVLFLYHDKRFQKGILIDNFTRQSASYQAAYQSRTDHFEYTLQAPGWEQGNWDVLANGVLLSTPGNSNTLHQQADGLLRDTGTNTLFYSLTDNEVIDTVLTFEHFIYTRAFMEANLKNATAVVNMENYGHATVFKNFELDAIKV